MHEICKNLKNLQFLKGPSMEMEKLARDRERLQLIPALASTFFRALAACKTQSLEN